mmetsp:Transcript_17784/g.2466  ORF Transcript_17784/g.2466 Transcript_17784/m.2466 type:complete len:98 (+) Transcript_17784:183-476(+)
MATLFTGDLVTLGINDLIHYNFGSPRIGNHAYVKWLHNSLKHKIYRITHHKDPVVHIPFYKSGYRHMPSEIHYKKNPGPHAAYIICNGTGEDSNCAD